MKTRFSRAWGLQVAAVAGVAAVGFALWPRPTAVGLALAGAALLGRLPRFAAVLVVIAVALSALGLRVDASTRTTAASERHR